MFLIILFIYLIPAAILAELVYRDAKKNSTQSASMWSIMVLLFFLLGALMYVLIGREPHERSVASGPTCRECGANINERDEFCSSCGTEFERVECESCGENTSTNADFCSKCGAELGRSEPEKERDSRVYTKYEKKGGDGEHRRYDPEYESEGSGVSVSSSRWYYGVMGGGILWAVFLIVDTLLMNIEVPIMAYVMTVGWFLIPLCLYLDTQYVLSNSEWNPKYGSRMAALGLIPYLNIAVAAMYLHRRNNELKIPSWDSMSNDMESLRKLV